MEVRGGGNGDAGMEGQNSQSSGCGGEGEAVKRKRDAVVKE